MKGLKAMKKHIVKATILVTDKLNVKYNVCYLEQVFYEDDNFEYVFRPNYFVIELLDSKTFQGIPGLNLDLKKKEYVRKNKIPTFIYERTPQKNREDLWDLLDEVGLEYLDHLEWLIRTDTTYTGDNLTVEAFKVPKERKGIDEVAWGDTFVFNAVSDISADNFTVIKFILDVITKGSFLKAGDYYIDDNNRKAQHALIYLLFNNETKRRSRKQKIGIEKAKQNKKYSGRKKISVSIPLLHELSEKIDRNEMTVNAAAEVLNISSRTLYRRLEELKK